jgi:hypothetical protein
VALHLAGAGHEIVALDGEQALLDELDQRAAEHGFAVETVVGDARELDGIDGYFGAILAPMQLVHLLGGEAGREALLRGAGGRLTTGGVLAVALLTEEAFVAAAQPSPPLLPDVRELDGWVYSSQPLAIDVADGGGIEIRRLRQTVSPDGELSDEAHSIRLDSLSADRFEAEAVAAGLRPRQRIDVRATDDHFGSTICVLEAG